DPGGTLLRPALCFVPKGTRLHGPAQARRSSHFVPTPPEKNYSSRNTCVRNVSRPFQSCDTCRVLVHLPQDRARFALHATENIWRMRAAHDRNLASGLAHADESR